MVRRTPRRSGVPRDVFGVARRAARTFESERVETPDKITATWQFTVEVSPDEMDGGFIARCIELPGTFSEGETEAEALSNVADAITEVMNVRMRKQLEPDTFGPQNAAGTRRVAVCV